MCSLLSFEETIANTLMVLFSFLYFLFILFFLGLKGQSNKRLISLNEVKQHQTDGAMWTVLKGRVYNIAPYMKFHPGGTDIILVLTCQIIVPPVFFGT